MCGDKLGIVCGQREVGNGLPQLREGVAVLDIASLDMPLHQHTFIASAVQLLQIKTMQVLKEFLTKCRMNEHSEEIIVHVKKS